MEIDHRMLRIWDAPTENKKYTYMPSFKRYPLWKFTGTDNIV